MEDKRIVNRVFTLVRERLPLGWSVGVPKPVRSDVVSWTTTIESPRGDAATLNLVVRSEVSPRDISVLRAKLRDAPNVVVVAPYIAASTRALLQELDLGYADERGNVRVALTDPSIFIDVTGDDSKPAGPKRGVSSLAGAKAGWIARTLIETKEPMSVSELAAKSGANVGYTSRVLEFLDAQNLVKKDRLGRPTSIDWLGLLHRWAADAPFESRGTLHRYLAPQGLAPVLNALALRNDAERYAVTGSHAAARFSSIAPARVLVVHTEDARSLAEALKLRPAATGANVIFLDANDEMPFTGSVQHQLIWYAPLVLVAADLLTLPGRAPAEGEAVLRWMKENENEWR